MFEIKKLNEDVVLPKYESKQAAGMDVHAYLDDSVIIVPTQRVLIPTGLFMALEPGYELQIRPRSGLAYKNGITVLNSPGTIDSDYRGEIKILLINHGLESFTIDNGMRIAQIIINKVEQVQFKEVDELSDTDRGSGGFGSTGI